MALCLERMSLNQDITSLKLHLLLIKNCKIDWKINDRPKHIFIKTLSWFKKLVRHHYIAYLLLIFLLLISI